MHVYGLCAQATSKLRKLAASEGHGRVELQHSSDPAARPTGLTDGAERRFFGSQLRDRVFICTAGVGTLGMSMLPHALQNFRVISVEGIARYVGELAPAELSRDRLEAILGDKEMP
jgi:hypothetical protein